MVTNAGNRSRLYALTGVLCLLLVFSLVLLCVLHHYDGSGAPTMRTISLYSNELSVPPEGATRLTVPMEEISIREVDEQVRYSFLTGIGGRGGRSSHPDVKYPDFKSDTPCFGHIYLLDGDNGWRLHFALDHSGGEPGVYDLLYFDEDYDFDLTNNAPLHPLKDPTGLPQPRSAGVESIWFEPLSMPFYFELDGPRPIELRPRLQLYKDRDLEPQVSLIATKIRKGRFEFDGRTYDAFLGYGGRITGRLDRATSILRLACEGDEQIGAIGAEPLNLMRSLGGRWCRFSCTPTGDQLFVYPYEGPVGTLRLDAGKRDVKRLELLGHLQTPGARIAVGRMLESDPWRGEDRYDLPVGDYYPEYLNILMGNTAFAVSGCPYRNTSGRHRTDRAVCNIAIREGKPCTLDFSSKPRVVFVRPEGKDRIARGDELRIEAVLVDPVLDVMIRGLCDMAQSEVKTFTMPDGRKRTFEWAPSLEPTVVIRRANGDIVGRGVMPFG